MSIVVTRPVYMKIVITETVKRQMTQEIESALGQIDLQLQQFEFQGRRYLADIGKTDVRQLMTARAQFEEEKQKMEAVKAELLQRKAEIDRVSVGSEFVSATLESNVTIEVGDRVSEKLSPIEIVVQDDVIIAIREGRGPQ